MKKILLAVIFGVASLSSISTKAQINISLNIGPQPKWESTGIDYYYLPDIDAYYYVPAKQYVYLRNGAWIFNKALPSTYGNFDLYKSYKVAMNTPKPYLSHNVHVKEYSKYRGYKEPQPSISEPRNTRYATTVRSSRTAVGNDNRKAIDYSRNDNRPTNGSRH